MKEVSEYLLSIGEPLPNPMLSVGWLARNEHGEVEGIMVVQSLPLCEPCMGTSSEIVRNLFSHAEKWIKESLAPRVLMHTSHPAMKMMLKRKGAEPSSDEWFDWRKQ